MNVGRYIKVLEDRLFVTLEIHCCNIFQHNSTPCHTAKVKKWLSEKNVSEWPGNSSDINPIRKCLELHERQTER